MPELPEVETIRRTLSPFITGNVISEVTVYEPKVVHGDYKNLIQKTIKNVNRHGKVLVLELDENVFISFHLKMTGQVLYHKDYRNPEFLMSIPIANTTKMPGKTTRVSLAFSNGSILFFNDSRKFGWMKISDKPEVPKGEDAHSSEFTLDYFKQVVESSNKPIKLLLTDQDKIAGIGNIYANDSLWEAKIHPEKRAKTLSKDEIKQLYEGIRTVLTDGITQQGSSAKDEIYILPDGSKGNYQHHFRVYGQQNKPCKRCGTSIVRIKQGGRSTFYCPTCQVI